jgi:hypothetical protein
MATASVSGRLTKKPPAQDLADVRLTISSKVLIFFLLLTSTGAPMPHRCDRCKPTSMHIGSNIGQQVLSFVGHIGYSATMEATFITFNNALPPSSSSHMSRRSSLRYSGGSLLGSGSGVSQPRQPQLGKSPVALQNIRRSLQPSG